MILLLQKCIIITHAVQLFTVIFDEIEKFIKTDIIIYKKTIYYS